MTVRLTGYDHDGYRFDVRDEGPLDGAVILALHGFPQTSESWRHVIPHLTAAGFRVLAPDQRGYSPGARPRALAAYRLDRLVGDVLALADAAGADTFHLLGHDWGGAVAWQLAAAHPARLRSLSVVSTPHPGAALRALLGRQALRSWYVLYFQLPGVPELLLQAQRGDLLRRSLRSTGAEEAEIEAAVALLSRPEAATGALNWYRALRLPGQPRTGPVTVPTLYVWGDRDTALDRRSAAGTAQYVRGAYRFEVLPGVSHWVPEQRPAELAALVLSHVAAHP